MGEKRRVYGEKVQHGGKNRKVQHCGEYREKEYRKNGGGNKLHPGSHREQWVATERPPNTSMIDDIDSFYVHPG